MAKSAYDSRRWIPMGRNSVTFEKGFRGVRRCGTVIEDAASDLEGYTRRGGAKMKMKEGYHSTFLSTIASFKRMGGCINLLPGSVSREEIHRRNDWLVGAGPEDLNRVGQLLDHLHKWCKMPC
uniref:Uncharacterized protein n=1 Tax=Ananas comosus var. bracteatus TaxID=296719 RepID=A0A6V7NM05_ANACO|nr:unnamed protein product [Ananas comosus var. bracteatus]